MKKDKTISLILSIALCAFTFFNLFCPNSQLQKYILTAFLVLFTVVAVRFIKFNNTSNLNTHKIILLISILSIVHILILYFIGIWAGFYRNSNLFSLRKLFYTILPYIVIIVCSEIIRQAFASKQSKANLILITISLILAETTTYFTQYTIATLNETLILFGYVFLPAISTNILCNYIVKRYGLLPNILYRVITTIYIYIFSILPDIYMFFQSIYRIIYPYFIYIILDKYFEKKKFEKSIKNKKVNIISFLFCIVLSTSFAMLISCQFRYGILVVGSSSMAGTINKGDAIVFEQYNKQKLKKGQIIVFIKDNIKTIHCIENIQIRNDETIYFTKGTNNLQQDEGYRTDSDIIGIVKFRIIAIGWPTIWLNNLFHH